MINFKRSLAVLLLSAATLTTFAQNGSEEFNPYLDIRGQFGAGYTVGETSFSYLLSPAAAGSLGYQFSPIFGLRLGASGWEANGRAVLAKRGYSFNYLQANLDATFNIVNIFEEYNSERLFNPYLLVGAGFNCSFNNDEATAIENRYPGMLENYWSGKQFFVVGRLGLGTDIRLSDAWAINVEVNTNVLSDKFNSKDAPTPDFQFNALAGLTYKFGTKKAAAAAVAAEEAAAAAAAAEAIKAVEEQKAAEAKKAAEEKAAEAKRVAAEEKKAAKKAAAQKARKEAAAKAKAPHNIFFELASDDLSAASKADLNQLAAYMKSNPSTKVLVTGYADAKTGSASYNAKLSAKRAVIVEKYLAAQGIESNKIVTDSKGSSVQPFEENEKNRVVICVVK